MQTKQFSYRASQKIVMPIYILIMLNTLSSCPPSTYLLCLLLKPAPLTNTTTTYTTTTTTTAHTLYIRPEQNNFFSSLWADIIRTIDIPPCHRLRLSIIIWLGLHPPLLPLIFIYLSLQCTSKPLFSVYDPKTIFVSFLSKKKDPFPRFSYLGNLILAFIIL